MARRKSKLPRQEISCKIEKFSHDGKGITHIDGRTVFVDGALPGETVKIQYTGKRQQVFQAKVVAILESSDSRVEPICEFYHQCGGCSLQHLAHPQQVIMKQQQMLDTLSHLGKVKPEKVVSAITACDNGYRCKARLGVRYVRKKQKLLIGFREKNSNFLTAMSYCPVLHPMVGLQLDELSAAIAKLSCYDQIPQIEVAVGDQSASLIIRHLQELTGADRAVLQDFAQRQQFHILLQAAGPDSIEPLYPQHEHNRPALYYFLPEYNIYHHFHASDFTQVNRLVNRQMIVQALNWLQLEPGDRVLDLFCGLGNFTLPMASTAQLVVGVEGSMDLIRRARLNASINQIDNVEFFHADLFVDEGGEAFTRQPWYRQGYDKILLDPARSGAQQVVQHILPLQAKRIVYVSCNPATLARDAGILVNQLGYTLEKAGIMDMFPHTSHVESMALFTRK